MSRREAARRRNNANDPPAFLHSSAELLTRLRRIRGVRDYLVVQKSAGQGFLNLFRFYWNTRIREWGPGRGTSPYEALTGKRVKDWLTLLGYPPSETMAAAA